MLKQIAIQLVEVDLVLHTVVQTVFAAQATSHSMEIVQNLHTIHSVISHRIRFDVIIA